MAVQQIRKVAVIGVGLMGPGIAQEFAQAGYEVAIKDLTEQENQRALSNIGRNLDLFAEHGLIGANEIPTILSRIHSAPALPKASEDADFVVEAVFEDLPLKQQIFRELDEACPPHAILASNSSSFKVSRYACATKRPEQVLGTHYYNPPHLVPLVEVIKGDETSEETVTTTVDFMTRVGKRPVVIQRDVAGFIGNRIIAAIYREALAIVEQGIATPQDVDIVVKSSFGRRMGVMGPFEQSDIIGADLVAAVMTELFPEIDRSTGPSAVLEKQKEKGELGMKTGKGFYTWTPESMEATRNRIALTLLRMLKEERREEQM